MYKRIEIREKSKKKFKKKKEKTIYAFDSNKFKAKRKRKRVKRKSCLMKNFLTQKKAVWCQLYIENLYSFIRKINSLK